MRSMSMDFSASQSGDDFFARKDSKAQDEIEKSLKELKILYTSLRDEFNQFK